MSFPVKDFESGCLQVYFNDDQNDSAIVISVSGIYKLADAEEVHALSAWLQKASAWLKEREK